MYNYNKNKNNTTWKVLCAIFTHSSEIRKRKRKTTAGMITSLKKQIRAISNFIALIPSRSIRQLMANFSEDEF